MNGVPPQLLKGASDISELEAYVLSTLLYFNVFLGVFTAFISDYLIYDVVLIASSYSELL